MIGKNALAAGLFGVSMLTAVTGGAATGASASGTAPSAGVSSGTLDCRQLESLWESGGGSASTAYMAAEIAMAESTGRQYATDNDGNGTTDRGYWQINSIHGAMSTYNALGNAKAAVAISDDGTNWTWWTTYTSGAYEGQC